jgi:hypothetical protein
MDGAMQLVFGTEATWKRAVDAADGVAKTAMFPLA